MVWRGRSGWSEHGDYISRMVEVFGKSVECCDGVCWLNIGDAYAKRGSLGCIEKGVFHNSSTPNTAHKNNKLYPRWFEAQRPPLLPARLALALQDDGWWVRSEVIWSKPNPMPESITDRPTSAHKKVFLLSKSQRTSTMPTRCERLLYQIL